jgi:phosphoglycerol transferase MdoB-like AlkP superfamily enzyme
MNRYKFLYYFAIVFLIVDFFTRIALLFYSYDSVDLSVIALLKVFAIGLFYDIVAFFYYSIPFVIYLFLVPDKIFNAKIHRIISLIVFFGVLYSVIFNGFSEWFFWNEFGKRFNFIAVDYLVYTHEVIQNIMESYPMPLLLSIIFLVTAGIFAVLFKKSRGFFTLFEGRSTYRKRLAVTLVLLAVPLFAFYLMDKQNLALKVSGNRYNQELAKDGLYSLFSAFRNNTLDYDEFYLTQPIEKVLRRYRKLVSTKNSRFVSDDLNNTLRIIDNTGEEQHYNVMLVMIESMSASFMGVYGNKQGLTPHMDALAKQSLFFDNFFATGTRTVRGMEAVTMSVPPTPGRSIVKRPDNHNMFGIGWIFKEKGYENKFIYAGHGYFDNMNEYFSHNGFKIVDRNSFDESEVTFANVWGVCDEDLFAKSIKESDKSYKERKPFFNFIMTTSNHRPFTYPDGRIDIPSHTGRNGGVKYTDFAIDKFLKDASKKPWFDSTIFVFVADHNGGSAGKTELPLYRYKIPLIVYAPKLIKPAIVSTLSSQIDLAPTLFALMHWDYKSKFYGKDILSEDFVPRALIGNYQKLGLYQDGILTMLLPDKTAKAFSVDRLELTGNKYTEIKPDENDLNDTVGYYQSASYFYKHKLDRYTPPQQ